jgi:DNA polymerase-1
MKVYGSSPNGIALNLGISRDQAEQLISLYFDAFPLIKVYVDCTHAMAKGNQYVVTPFGQRKMEYGAHKIFEGTAVYNGCLRNSQNVRVQSTSSTFGMQCFAALNRELKPLGGKCTCTVFDSLEMEVPLEVAAKVLELSFYYLNDRPVEVFDWLDLPVGVDAEIGLNWGDAVHISRGTTQQQIEEMYKEWTK